MTIQSAPNPTRQPEAHAAVALARRGLATTALLFVAGHAPLALVAGHGLALVAPVAGVLGVSGLQRWAELLINPDAAQQIEAALLAAESEAA